MAATLYGKWGAVLVCVLICLVQATADAGKCATLERDLVAKQGLVFVSASSIQHAETLVWMCHMSETQPPDYWDLIVLVAIFALIGAAFGVYAAASLSANELYIKVLHDTIKKLENTINDMKRDE